MKLRYLFSMIVASVLLFAGCVKEEATGSFANIQLDKTYLSIPEAGGSVSLKVNATEAWAIEGDIPEWLQLDKVEGAAGETTITITAGAVSGGREVELCIKAGVNKQFFRVRQGSLEAVTATCAEVAAGPDGKTFRVKGVVTSIVNTTYGNWYLKDDTGEIYVYGTLDKDGKTKNFSSLGLEVGDVVAVEGPKKDYNGTIELIDVTVLSIEKALLKILTAEPTVKAEGGEVTVKVAYKGKGVFPSVSADAQDWISIVSAETKFGEPTKIEPNPADTAIVKVKVAEFAEYEPKREGTIIFSSSMKNDDDEIVSTDTPFTITQTGLVVPTIAEVITAGATSSAKTQGVIVAKYNRGALISDGTGYILIYKNAAMEEVVGDKIEVNGPTSLYGGMLQFTADAEVTKISSENAVIHPEPTVLDAAGMEAQLAKTAVEYIEYVGTLSVSTNSSGTTTYYNVAVEGTTKAQGSLQYLDAAAFPVAVDGAEIKVRGYFIGVSSSKFVNTMAVVVAAADEEIEEQKGFTIANVLALGKDAVIPADTEVEAVVVSNRTLSNLTSKKGLYIQDATGGLQFYLAGDHEFDFGDKVKVDLSGAKLGAYNGAVQISGLALDKITKISSGNTVTPKTVTMADFLANKYEGQYIALEGVQVVSADLSKTFVMDGAHTSINMEDASGNKFVVFSSKYATYGTTAVPQGSGTIKGISSINNGAMQIIFAQDSDFDGLTGERLGE